MPPAKGTKYAKRQTTPEMLEAARNRPKKYATKQAANRETNRLRKLARQQTGKKHPRNDIVSPSMLERAAQEMAQIDAERRQVEAARLAVLRQSIADSECIAREKAEKSRQLYRETIAERRPIIAEREAKILESVKKAVAEADARAYELRHRGRPKSAKRLPPLTIRRSPDALLAAVPQWQGER